MTTETKDSGVKWIGTVPADWEINKIKYIAVLKGRIGWQGLTSEEYTDEGAYLITGVDFENGNINWDSCVHVPMHRWEEARDIQIENGDLLITKDGTIGKVAIVSGCTAPTSLNSGVLRVSTIDGYDRRFLYWVLQSDVFWTWFADKNAGNSTIQHLYQGDFAEFKYAIPPIGEQRAIAAFLDAECAKIDSIIDDLERQIEVLKKHRRSIITETVTKGLNKNTPLHDSGNPYVGEIAADAQAIRFKYVASIDADLVDPAKYADMPQVSPENIVANTGELVDIRTVEEVGVDSWNQRFFTGQIIYSKIRPALNKVTIAPFDGLCSADMYPISTKLPTRYLMYFMLSDAFVSQTIEVSSIRVKMPKVNQEELKNFIVVTHPQDAMLQIAEYLDQRCEIIDAILRQKETQQDMMRRQKESLIYEYVTGKKRVKEVTSHAD